MEIITVPVAANDNKVIHTAGEYFEIIESVDPVDVVLYEPNSGAQSSALQAVSGIYMRVPFNTINIKSSTAQTLRILVAEKEGGTRRQSGSVVVTNVPHVVVDSLPDDKEIPVKEKVINSSYVQGRPLIQTTPSVILTNNPNRRYFLLQNKSLETIYLSLDGVMSKATESNGIWVKPGETFETKGWVPNGPIAASASANTSEVVWVSG